MYLFCCDGVRRIFSVAVNNSQRRLWSPGITFVARNSKLRSRSGFPLYSFLLWKKEFQFRWSSSICNYMEAEFHWEQLCQNGQGFRIIYFLQLQQRSMPSRKMTRMNTTFWPFITIPSHFNWTPTKNTRRTTRFLQPITICHNWRLIQRLGVKLIIWVSSPSMLPGFRKVTLVGDCSWLSPVIVRGVVPSPAECRKVTLVNCSCH